MLSQMCFQLLNCKIYRIGWDLSKLLTELCCHVRYIQRQFAKYYEHCFSIPGVNGRLTTVTFWHTVQISLIVCRHRVNPDHSLVIRRCLLMLILFIYCTISSSPSPKTSAVTTPVRYDVRMTGCWVVSPSCDLVIRDVK